MYVEKRIGPRTEPNGTSSVYRRAVKVTDDLEESSL